MAKPSDIDWTTRLDDARLLTIYEIAEIFQRQVGTIRKQLGEGRFEVAPRVRVPRQATLWSPLDVKAWLSTPPAKRGGAR